MDKQPATVTFKFPVLEPTLADLKAKVQAVLDSDALAKKFAAEFPQDATARGGYKVQTISLTGSGTVSDTGGKRGEAGTVGFGITWGAK